MQKREKNNLSRVKIPAPHPLILNGPSLIKINLDKDKSPELM